MGIPVGRPAYFGKFCIQGKQHGAESGTTIACHYRTGERGHISDVEGRLQLQSAPQGLRGVDMLKQQLQRRSGPDYEIVALLRNVAKAQRLQVYHLDVIGLPVRQNRAAT